MIAIQKAGELPKTIFPTGRRATMQPVLTAVAVLFLILLSLAAVADTGWQNLDDVSAGTSNWKFDPGGTHCHADPSCLPVHTLKS
jgi:hypothetical protein